MSSSTVYSSIPTIGRYNWSATPVRGQSFSSSITGTSFVPGTQVWFCVSGTTNCYPNHAMVVVSSKQLAARNLHLNTESGKGHRTFVQPNRASGVRYTTPGTEHADISFEWTASVNASAYYMWFAVTDSSNVRDLQPLYFAQNESSERILKAGASTAFVAVAEEPYANAYFWKSNEGTSTFGLWSQSDFPRPRFAPRIEVQMAAEPRPSSIGWLTTLALLVQGIISTINAISASIFWVDRLSPRQS